MDRIFGHEKNAEIGQSDDQQGEPAEQAGQFIAIARQKEQGGAAQHDEDEHDRAFARCQRILRNDAGDRDPAEHSDVARNEKAFQRRPIRAPGDDRRDHGENEKQEIGDGFVAVAEFEKARVAEVGERRERNAGEREYREKKQSSRANRRAERKCVDAHGVGGPPGVLVFDARHVSPLNGRFRRAGRQLANADWRPFH